MTDERRYSDEEVEAILALALSPESGDRPALRPDHGLTLSALQEVGREVGVPPERIAEAARMVSLRLTPPQREVSLGMPIGIGRVVELPRALAETEWDALVALLQQTFRARGRAASLAGSRAWTNNNLRVAIDNTPDGTRLTMSTLRSGAREMNRVGVAAFALGAALLGVVLMGISPPALEQGLLWSFAIGAGALGANALRLPAWARAREQQMDEIAHRVQAMLTPSQHKAVDDGTS